ncbi:Uncharacterised protein [Serratia quinivorans]|nr:Uncharacterised protein [Serratia quinivorans]CAI1851348.1 Uncharacterised protein [Serratia quinivorans]
MKTPGSTMLLLSYFLTTPALSLEFFPPIDRTKPIQQWPMPVTMNQDRLPYMGKNLGPGYGTSVHIHVLVPGPTKSGPGVYFDAAVGNNRLQCDGDRTTDTVTCDGIYLGPWGKKPDDTDAVRVIRHVMQTQPIHLNFSQNGIKADQCSVIAKISYNGVANWSWGHYTDSCTLPPVQPQPVSCTVSGPSTLSHPNQQSTKISGSIRDKWQLSCTNDTLVTVSTTRDVMLNNHSGEIATGLYVERTGVTTLDVFVERTADVYIVSELETPSASPGLYTGSGIIYVTWY